MQGILKIFKLDEPKKGISSKNGKPYEIHTAQCALLTADGELDQVGVLDIPPSLRGKVVPGIFVGSYAMGVNFSNGKIGPVLQDLVPYAVKDPAQRAAAAAVPPART
jgi:hypothetical protein